MARLIPKSDIQSLNIDTVERAIIFAGLCLEIAQQYNIFSPATEIEINPIVNRTDSYLSLSFSCPLDSPKYTRRGGGLFLNSLQTTEPTSTNIVLDFIIFQIKPTANLALELPDYPESFTSFEQYLTYYFFIYWASLDSKYSRTVKFNLLSDINTDTGIKEYSIEIDLKLPIDLNTWLLGNNYIESVKHTLTSYVVPDYPITLSELTNDLLLTNEVLLAN